MNVPSEHPEYQAKSRASAKKSSKRIDTDALKRDVDLRALIGKVVKLRPNGREFTGLCPFHQESNPSFHVVPDKGFYHCFSCNAHGDAIDFLMEIEGASFRDACSRLGADSVVQTRHHNQAARQENVDTYATLELVPLGAVEADHFKAGEVTPQIFNPKRADDAWRRFGSFAPSLVHPYRNEAGDLLGYVLRHDLPDGGKETPVIQRITLDGEATWARVPFREARPLYGLDRLAANPEHQVLAHEGEKSADAGERMLQGKPVVNVAWPGGANSADKVDAAPLKGRIVIGMPDADEQGYKAMLGYERFNGDWKPGFLELALKAGAAEVSLIHVLATDKEGFVPSKEGWDIADGEEAGWNADDVLKWGKERRIVFSSVEEIHDAARRLVTMVAAMMRGDAQESEETPAVEGKVEPMNDENMAADGGEEEERSAIAAEGKAIIIPPSNAPNAGTAATSELTNKLGAVPAGDPHWESRIILDNNKTNPLPRAILANAVLAFRHAPALRGVFGFDEFAQRIVFLNAPPWNPRLNVYGETDVPVTDADIVLATDWVQRNAGIYVKENVVDAAIEAAAREMTFNPVRDYLNSLVWDGVPRACRWAIDHGGAEASEIVCEMSEKFLIGAVARAYEPGCKVDTMPILEGDQGLKKSSALQTLASKPWYADSIPDLSNKDAMLQIQGKWIIEMSELASLGRADVGKIKAFLSSPVDRYRAPFGKRPADHPRQCVFAGTVNPEDGYLRDATGARRFWPIKCTRKFDLDALAAERDQLWAEAVHRYRAGEPWWLSARMERTAANEQDERFQGDALDEVIARHLGGIPDEYKAAHGVSVGDVILGALQIPPEKWTRDVQMRVSSFLKREKWKRRQATAQGQREWRYFPPPLPVLRSITALGRRFRVWYRTPSGMDRLWFFPDAGLWMDDYLDIVDPPANVAAQTAAMVRQQGNG